MAKRRILGLELDEIDRRIEAAIERLLDERGLLPSKQEPLFTCFIYALRDPDTEEIRYIGKANDPEDRLAQHIYQASRMEWLYQPYVPEKIRWLRQLALDDKEPRLEVLEEIPRRQTWRAERKWIAWAREQGHRLTNLREPV